MLLADIEFKYKGELYRYKGFLAESYSSTLVRLVAEDGDSANLLLDGHYSRLNTMMRTAQFNRANFKVERLFKPKTLLDTDGNDLSAPKVFQKSPAFALYGYLFSVFTYAKTYPTEHKTNRDGEIGFDIVDSVSSLEVKDYFKTPIGSGYVVRRLNSVVSLEFTPKGDSPTSIRVSIQDEPNFENLPSYKRKEAMGSDVLRMESTGTAYSVDFPNEYRRRVLRFPIVKQEVVLKGINSNTYSPFYETVQDVINAEYARAKAEERQPRNFEWIKKRIEAGDYHIVKPDEVEEYFEKLEQGYQKTGLVAFDTETTGLRFNFKCFTGEGDKMVGAVLSSEVGTSYYFPVAHTKFPNVCGGDIEYFVEKYLAPFLKGKKVVCHNNYFDWKVGYSHGLIYNCYFDTMVFMRKTFSPRDGLDYGLKDTTEYFLKRTAPELDDLCKNHNFKETKAQFSDLEKELVELYACPDADNTLSLALYFIKNGIVDEFNAWKPVTDESAFSSVVAYCEFYGNHLNLEAVPALREEYEKRRVKLFKDLYEFIAVVTYDVNTNGGVPVKFKSSALEELYATDYDGFIKTPIEEFAGVSTDTKNAYTVSSTPLNLRIAYDILGYPVQISKKSNNPTLDKNALKALTRATKPNTAPYELSREDAVKELSKVIDRVTGLDKLVTRLHSYNAEMGISLSEAEHEVLRIAGKYLYTLKYGWRTEVSLTTEGTLMVEPEVDAPIYPFANLLKESRDLNRVFTNFLDKIDEYFTSDGFCFPSIDAFKVTGRLSTKAPNIQGFDDVVKKEITARDGYYMVDMDYASKENRVIAIMSQEQALLDMFKDWRNDYHRFQASRLRGLLQEQVTDDLRKESKGLVFGINFGMSDMSLGEVLFGSRSAENRDKASDKRALFFSFQRNVERWFENNVKTALDHGYSETIFGNRRYYNRKTTSRAQIRRYALNHPIQGSAADIYKRGMIDLFNDIIREGYLGKILITGFIHDEATLEVHKDIHPLVILGMLRKNMMVDLPNGCPLDIGFGVGDSWYTAKKVEWQVGLQEKLEWNVGLYDWDGDIHKFSDWAVKQIHQFNADDVIQMLDGVNFPADAKDTEKVFPVNFGLELNKYLLVELMKDENWRKATPYIELPDDWGISSAKTRSGFFYRVLGDLHIKKRLSLFKDLTGYGREGIEDMFVDLSEIVVEESSQNQERDEIVARQEEEERALRLITEQVVDFGMKLQPESNLMLLLYSKDLYRVIKQLIKPAEECAEGYRIVFYSMKDDALKELTGWRLPEENVSHVRSALMSMGFFA